MSDNLYDLEEIIAEIKSQDGTFKKSAGNKKEDGEKSSPHPKSDTLKSPADIRGKHEAMPKAHPMHNMKIKVRTEKNTRETVAPDAKHPMDANAKKIQPKQKKPHTKTSNTDEASTLKINTQKSGIFKKALDELFSEDTPAKKLDNRDKKKKKPVDIDEVEDLNENEDHISDEEAERKLPYDFLNCTYPDPEEALFTISQKLMSSGMRLLALFPVWLISLYMTLAFPLKLPMPFGFSYFTKPFLYLLLFFVLECAALILASDVTASGLARLIKSKPTLDTLVLFASLSSMAYILTVIIRPQWGGWLPFTSATVGLCFFALASKRRRFVALKRTYKILRSDTSPASIKCQGPRRYKTAFKTYKNAFPEMADLSAPDSTERLSLYYAPLAILVCIALAAAASFGRQDAKSFTWCLSALSVVTVSPALLISSTLPQSIIGKKLFVSGSTFTNSKAAFELSRCRSAILTDNDVFPTGSIAITSLKIGNSFSLEYAYSVAASALEAIGGGLYGVFDESARQLYAQQYDVEDVRFFESGGMSARVDGNYVLMGTASFLMRMGVEVLHGVKLQNCIYMSVNSRFAGVFSLKYTAQPTVYSAFRLLRRSKTTPILALRDFLTTEAFIEDKFKLHADTCNYPSTEERVQYSGDNFEDSEPLAVLSHSNMFSYAELLLSAKKLSRTVTFNLICSLLGCIVGILIMYFLVSNMEVSSASPLNILVYMGCWALPVWLSSLIFTAF